MKKLIFLLLVFISCSCSAQHPIKLVRLWKQPEVHLIYREYHLFFTIKDINTAMKYLHQINPEEYDSSSHLDTNRLYSVELVDGRDMEYMKRLQPLLQNEVAAYLLYKGHAYIMDPKHKKVRTIIANAGPRENRSGSETVMIYFFDAKTKKQLFAGMMNVELQHRYLELE